MDIPFQDFYLPILKGAKEIIKTEVSWTQRSYAKDKNGGTVFYNDDKACKWCVEGALMKASWNIAMSQLPKVLNSSHPYAVMTFLDLIAGQNFENAIAVNVNDDLGFNATHALLDLAIDYIEKRQSEDSVHI